MDRRRFMAGTATATAGALAVFGGATPSSASEASTASGTGSADSAGDHVKGVTAITQVFGAGQKLVAVAVEYDREIAGRTLSASTFSVTDRTVTKVYANRSADLAQRSRDGRYVVVELSPDDTAAALWVTGQGSGTPPTGGGTAGTGDSGGGVGAGGPQVGDTTPGGTIVAAKATLTQSGTVTTRVATALWDGQSTAAGFAADVRAMKAQRTPVNFSAFKTGTTVPSGSTTSAHMGTWQIAYTIPGIRDWIMRQSR
ncbi:hypothetical protein ACFWOB_37395 [Streptomyces sp. NPDC058420]|uniref:hypothetical protein n=1 Tax=Streptomyces sp. NPDC058420 TaxID=3346489 RepID=UPI00365CDB56